MCVGHCHITACFDELEHCHCLQRQLSNGRNSNFVGDIFGKMYKKCSEVQSTIIIIMIYVFISRHNYNVVMLVDEQHFVKELLCLDSLYDIALASTGRFGIYYYSHFSPAMLGFR